MQSEYISYDNLPQFNTIFRDYCIKGTISEFYSYHFQDLLSGNFNLGQLSNKIYHRQELCDILIQTNSQLNCSDKTLQNINILKSDMTYAVVTGQQMGLYSGPIYTIYKTIGAIKTAEILKVKYPEYNFIPVFWLEQEDSDFQEINNISIISKNNEIVKCIYSDSYINELNDPIFRHVLTDDINEINKKVFDEITQTDFTKTLSDFISYYYQPGKTISEAFAGFLLHLFDKFGLVVFNPSVPGLKKKVKNIFKQSIEKAEEIYNIVQIRSKKLSEAGFFSQVDTRPSYVYYLDLGEKKNRLNLNQLNKFRIKTPIDLEDKSVLLNLIDYCPENFIPNVLLRPIVQDSILPTIAYIAGPGEVAYFAQTTPLYEYFNIRQPFIVPRPTVTIIEKKNKNHSRKVSVECYRYFKSA